MKDIVNTVEIRYLHADKHGMEATILDLKSLKGSIKEQRHRDFGRCYTFTPDVRAQKLGIGSIRTTLYVRILRIDNQSITKTKTSARWIK